jgi:hypothetical protein
MPTSEDPVSEQSGNQRARRRWLLGLEPFFEGGWLHKGTRAQTWDVEGGLIAVAVLGDVVVDLSMARTTPTKVYIDAYAIGRDVDVVLPEGVKVELSGRPNNDRLRNYVSSGVGRSPQLCVLITGHTFLGDVNVCTARAGTKRYRSSIIAWVRASKRNVLGDDSASV